MRVLTPRQLQAQARECFAKVRKNHTDAIEWISRNKKHAITPGEIQDVEDTEKNLYLSLERYDQMVEQVIKGIHQVALQGRDTSIVVDAPIEVNHEAG